MDLSLPRRLGDVIGAPTGEHGGNRIHSNWTFEWSDYSFHYPGSFEMTTLNYYSESVWPSLNSFIDQIIQTAEPSDAPLAVVRKILHRPESALSALTYLAENVKGLQAIGIVTVICFLLLVPIASIVAFCVSRKIGRYRLERCKSQHSMLNYGRGVRASLYSSEILVFLALVAIIFCVGALIGTALSFHFNNVFSYGLRDKLNDTITDGMGAAFHIAEEFSFAAEKLTEDIDVKLEFLENTFGNMFESGEILMDLGRTSKAMGIFFAALLWEANTINPILNSITELETGLARYEELKRAVNESSDFDFELVKQQACHNVTAYRNPGALASAFATSQTCRRIGSPSPANLTTVCSRCIVPRLADSVTLFHEPLHDIGRVRQVLATLKDKMTIFTKTKLGDIALDLEPLKQKFMGVTENPEERIGYYTKWLKYTLEPVTEGTRCDIDPDKIITSTTVTTVSPTTPATTTSVTTTTAVSTTTTTGITTTTEPETTTPSVTTTTTEPPPEESQLQQIMNQVTDSMYTRHYIILALLIVAVISLVFMAVGLICLALVFLSAAKQRRNQTALAGRILLTIGVVLYVAVLGPLISLTALAHFVAGVLTEKSFCHAVKSGNNEIFDSQLGQSALKGLLPVCIDKLIHSIDPVLFKRVTISKLLHAAENDWTINELVQLNDTKFVREFLELTHVNTTVKFDLYSGEITEYLEDLQDVVAANTFFQPLINGINLDEARDLRGLVLNCTECVLEVTSNSAEGELKDLLSKAKNYKEALVKYLERFQPVFAMLADQTLALRYAEKGRSSMVELYLYIEDFFEVAFMLLIEAAKQEVQVIFDKVFEAFTRDVGHLGNFYVVYDAVIREFACIEIAGSMNAFWFFLGVYLLLAVVAVIIGFLLLGTLSAYAQAEPGGNWESRGNQQRNAVAASANQPNPDEELAQAATMYEGQENEAMEFDNSSTD